MTQWEKLLTRRQVIAACAYFPAFIAASNGVKGDYPWIDLAKLDGSQGLV